MECSVDLLEHLEVAVKRNIHISAGFLKVFSPVLFAILSLKYQE
jgi:hypothetical protein